MDYAGHSDRNDAYRIRTLLGHVVTRRIGQAKALHRTGGRNTIRATFRIELLENSDELAQDSSRFAQLTVTDRGRDAETERE